MTLRDADHEAVRQAIAELRSADARGTPALRDVLARTRSRAVTEYDYWRMARHAVTAAVLIAAWIDVSRRIEARRSRLVVPAEVSELSAWRPLTDVLLATPNAGVLTGTPRIDESVLPLNPILEDDQ